MAKVASTLTLLSLLFAFTYAGTTFDIPENDVTFLDLPTPLPANDVVKPTLLLPSEKAIYEPNTPKLADNQTPVETRNDDIGAVAEEEDLKPVEGENRLVAEEEDQKPVEGENDGVVAVEEDQKPFENKIYGLAAVKGKEFDREMFHRVSTVHPRWMKYHHHHGEHEGRPWFPSFGRHHHHDHDDHHHQRHDHHDDNHNHNHHHDDDDHDDDHDHHDHHHDDDDHDDDHDHHDHHDHDHHREDDDHDDDHDHNDHHGEHQRSIRRPFIRRDQVEEEKEEREGDGGFLDGILDLFDDLF